MTRSLWKRALFGMAGVGLSGALVVMNTQAQPNVEPPRSGATAKSERVVTLYENGKRLRCRLLHTWKLPDGSTAHQLATMVDGEMITLIEDGTSTRMDGKEARPTRIYHWGLGATTPPAGIPSYPGSQTSTAITVSNPGTPQFPNVSAIPITSGTPRVIDLPNEPARSGATINTSGGPRMVEAPKSLPPVTNEPLLFDNGVPVPSNGRAGSRLFQGKIGKLPPGECSTCGETVNLQGNSPKTVSSGRSAPKADCPTCTPPTSNPIAAVPMQAPATGSNRPLFGNKNNTLPPVLAAGSNTAGEKIIMVTDPATGQPPMPILDTPTVATPKSDPPRGPLAQRLFGKATNSTVAEPKPAPPMPREPFSTASDPSLKKETKTPVFPTVARAPNIAAPNIATPPTMAPPPSLPPPNIAAPNIATPPTVAPPPSLPPPNIATPPNLHAEGPPPIPDPTKERDTSKPAAQLPKRDWRMSWGKNDAAKGEVPGQSTVEKAVAPPSSKTEKNFADVLLSPERVANERKPAPDLPPAYGKQPLPSGIGSVVAAGGPNGRPSFIPVPIATVPNVTRQPAPPQVQVPGGPPGPPSVNLPQPPNNPWANNAFTPLAPGANQAPPGYNAFMTPPPPPAAQPQAPGNAFDLPPQQQGNPAGAMQAGYYPPPAYPQAGYYPQPGYAPQAAYYPMPAQGYAQQIAYAPQPGYPVAPVGYQMPQAPANAAPNPAMDRRSGQSESQAVAQLVQVLHDSASPSQREWAALTLATYDHRLHPQVIEALSVAARQDPAGSVRGGCVYSLSRLGVRSETVLNTLQSLRTDSDPRVRQEVEEAHQRLGVK